MAADEKDSESAPESGLRPGDWRETHVLIGRVVKAHGIKGEVKIYPFSEDPSALPGYPEVMLQAPGGEAPQPQRILKGRMQGKLAVVQLAAVRTREQAEGLVGWDVWVEKRHLPPLAEDEFYWQEMEGRRVVTTDGRELGVVSGLLATAAYDVLVVTDGDREYLIPAIKEFLARMDEGAGPIVIAPVPGLLEIND